MEAKQERKVVNDPRGRGKLLIPKPLDVDVLIRKVQKGKKPPKVKDFEKTLVEV